MGVISFLTSWQFVLFFYAFVALLIYVNRSKFEFQAKIVALYRTKLGIKAMQRIATKHTKLVKFLGYTGIVVGYLGMLAIVYFIFKGMFNLVFVPDAPATLAPVIPGVKIPGSPIFVPFWYGILSLFFVIVIHEFSHGVVSKAHKIPVKSSGFVLFGPIPGAFVEPDEKVLKKKKLSVQNAVFAAGPFSNVLTAIIVLLLFGLVVNPMISSSFEPMGFSFSKVEVGSAAEQAGLQTGVVYNKVRGEEALNAVEFVEGLGEVEPGEVVSVGGDAGRYEVVAGTHPSDATKGYLGVNIISRFYNDEGAGFQFIRVIIEFLNWLFLLSLGLGLANLLPIGPVDGGRMFQLACWKYFGKKKGNIVWTKTSLVFLALIVILLLTPILKAIL